MLDNNTITVGPDEFPFYVTEPATAPVGEQKAVYEDNATYLANFRLTRSSAPSPNTLVPLGADGYVPLATIPPLAGSSAIIGATGTYAALKAAPLAGTYFAWATDIGRGALVLMTNNAGIGDAGWLVVAGG